VHKIGIHLLAFFFFLCVRVVYHDTAVTLSGASQSGSGSEPFRGLLVQGRQVAGASPVGVFGPFTANTKASACTPTEVQKKVTSLNPRLSPLHLLARRHTEARKPYPKLASHTRSSQAIPEARKPEVSKIYRSTQARHEARK